MIDDSKPIEIIVPSLALDCAITDLLEDGSINKSGSAKKRSKITKLATNIYINLINKELGGDYLSNPKLHLSTGRWQDNELILYATITAKTLKEMFEVNNNDDYKVFAGFVKVVGTEKSGYYPLYSDKVYSTDWLGKRWNMWEPCQYELLFAATCILNNFFIYDDTTRESLYLSIVDEVRKQLV